MLKDFGLNPITSNDKDACIRKKEFGNEECNPNIDETQIKKFFDESCKYETECTFNLDKHNVFIKNNG